MSIIKFYQNKLSSDTRYWSEALTTSIKFEPLLDKDSGFLYDVETGDKFPYSLTAVQSSVIIETEYFNDRFFIATSSLGFNLLDFKSKSVYLKFIDEFWVNHQDIIGAILNHLIHDSSEQQFTSEKLAKSLRGAFPSHITWNVMLSITERVMEMLIEDRSVNEGMISGQSYVSANKETRISVEENRYVFVKH